MDNKSVLFVFYKIIPAQSWTYTKMPKNWVWTGAGSTKSKSYPREEQFQGSQENLKEMKEYLHKFFTTLKQKNMIKKFKIRSTID